MLLSFQGFCSVTNTRLFHSFLTTRAPIVILAPSQYAVAKEKVVPFLLEERLKALGGKYSKARLERGEDWVG